VIADFIADTMSNYLNGGMSPETAARFTRGELEAIYKGDHRSRDGSGIWRVTPPPEDIPSETAMYKADVAIAEIAGRSRAPSGNPPGVYRGKDAVKQALAAGIKIKPFFAKSPDNDPDAYTSDPRQITVMWNDGQRRFKAFIRGRFLVLDVDRKPGKPDGRGAFYKMFPRETLPAEFQNLPESFPCYTRTPSGGFHLYFKYEGPELKLRELVPGVEIKERQITCPGSRRDDGGEYVLYGEPDKAPPLPGFIVGAVEETKRKKERAKAERLNARVKAAADRPVRFAYPRVTLDDLALEAAGDCSGHHDRQVSFAGKAFRCGYTAADALRYVKSNHAIFGGGADTENTVLSVYRDNGRAL